MEYFASTGNVVSSNLCVGSSKRIKIPFLLLSICTDELISTLKVMTFLPQSNFGSEKCETEPKPKPFLNKNIYLGQHF